MPLLVGLMRTLGDQDAPCADDPRWTSNEPEHRAAAAPGCRWCPALAQCDAYAQALQPVAGVWAGRRLSGLHVGEPVTTETPDYLGMTVIMTCPGCAVQRVPDEPSVLNDYNHEPACALLLAERETLHADRRRHEKHRADVRRRALTPAQPRERLRSSRPPLGWSATRRDGPGSFFAVAPVPTSLPARCPQGAERVIHILAIALSTADTRNVPAFVPLRSVR